MDKKYAYLRFVTNIFQQELPAKIGYMNISWYLMRHDILYKHFICISRGPLGGGGEWESFAVYNHISLLSTRGAGEYCDNVTAVIQSRISHAWLYFGDTINHNTV